MKHLRKFNENINEGFAENLEDKFLEVRDAFQDLEDDKIVNYYSIVFQGEEFGHHGLLFPLDGNYDSWFTNATSQLIKRDELFYKDQDSSGICIIVDLKLPIKKEEPYDRRYSGLVDSESFEKFEDLLEINGRLTSLGYKIKYDFGASHPDYKPIKILIYLTI